MAGQIYNRLTIVGFGLIGSSVARIAREKGVVAEVLPEVILRRRRHGRNLTANWSASADGMFAMLKRSMDRRRGAASGPPATG